MLSGKKLKQLEAVFLSQYPGAFEDPALQAVIKRHRVGNLTELARESFSKQACKQYEATTDMMIKVVGRSSMVSMFEKPKFRDFVKRLNNNDKAFLANALSQFLHGKPETGFTAMADILGTEKLAKWSLMTAIPAYYAPDDEVFVKPTTAKGILQYFEIKDPVYKPAPSWEFYWKYRELINEAKHKVDPRLSPSNAAFTGFLMMTVKT